MLAPKTGTVTERWKYSKLPEPQELSDRFGNPELSLKGTWQYGFGYEYRPDPFFHADFTLFYKKMFDLVGNNPDFVAGGSAPGLINNGDGRAYGLEVMLRHRPSPRPLYGWLAYTLSRSERFDRGDPDEGWTLFGLDQTHILSSVLGYKWGRGWSLGTTLRWITGNPTTPRFGARFDVDGRFYRPLRGDRRSDRLPDFFQMDLRLEKKSSKKRNAFIWYVDVLNLTNRQNIEFYIYQYDSALTLGSLVCLSSQFGSMVMVKWFCFSLLMMSACTVYDLESEGDIYRPRSSRWSTSEAIRLHNAFGGVTGWFDGVIDSTWLDCERLNPEGGDGGGVEIGAYRSREKVLVRLMS